MHAPALSMYLFHTPQRLTRGGAKPKTVDAPTGSFPAPLHARTDTAHKDRKILQPLPLCSLPGRLAITCRKSGETIHKIPLLKLILHRPVVLCLPTLVLLRVSSLCLLLRSPATKVMTPLQPRFGCVRRKQRLQVSPPLPPYKLCVSSLISNRSCDALLLAAHSVRPSTRTTRTETPTTFRT